MLRARAVSSVVRVRSLYLRGRQFKSDTAHLRSGKILLLFLPASLFFGELVKADITGSFYLPIFSSSLKLPIFLYRFDSKY